MTKICTEVTLSCKSAGLKQIICIVSAILQLQPNKNCLASTCKYAKKCIEKLQNCKFDPFKIQIDILNAVLIECRINIQPTI